MFEIWFDCMENEKNVTWTTNNLIALICQHRNFPSTTLVNLKLYIWVCQEVNGSK